MFCLRSSIKASWTWRITLSRSSILFWLNLYCWISLLRLSITGLAFRQWDRRWLRDWDSWLLSAYLIKFSNYDSKDVRQSGHSNFFMNHSWMHCSWKTCLTFLFLTFETISNTLSNFMFFRELKLACYPLIAFTFVIPSSSSDYKYFSLLITSVHINIFNYSLISNSPRQIPQLESICPKLVLNSIVWISTKRNCLIWLSLNYLCSSATLYCSTLILSRRSCIRAYKSISCTT